MAKFKFLYNDMKSSVMKPKKWTGIVEAIGDKYTMVVYPENKEVTFVLSKRSNQKNLADLEQYVDNIIEGLSGKTPSFDILERKEIILLKRPAIKMITKEDSKGSTKKIQSIYMINNNDFYIFQYSAKLELYDKHLETIDQMMDSLKIENF